MKSLKFWLFLRKITSFSRKRPTFIKSLLLMLGLFLFITAQTALAEQDPTDYPAPVIETTTPSPGSRVGGVVSLTVHVNANDNPYFSRVWVAYKRSGISGYSTEIGTDDDPSDGWNFTWDTTGLEEGRYYDLLIHAQADDGTSLASRIWSYYIVPAHPDFTINWLYDPPPSVNYGQEIALAIEVENQGNIEATNVGIRFFIDENPIRSYGILNLGAHSVNTSQIHWIADVSGSHTLKVIVDPDNEISESEETNNEVTAQIQIDQPPQPPAETPTQGTVPKIEWGKVIMGLLEKFHSSPTSDPTEIMQATINVFDAVRTMYDIKEPAEIIAKAKEILEIGPIKAPGLILKRLKFRKSMTEIAALEESLGYRISSSAVGLSKNVSNQMLQEYQACVKALNKALKQVIIDVELILKLQLEVIREAARSFLP